ncbi:prepilin-type N-terminal cleavage/methylation domain-containing protein [Cerasicoccus arenae]|uniref:Prepilin-type N-terminal cleavage/methylation domain-containing protein n=1 Tax=Cerasicoccus arenae TaxID=424488 RepID=A0A8J3DDB8_9BACT|nr:prepilin-type N-terminal cleavage/methylation domain-containing protein [Cerasicoccus arenae]MBK1859287.1 prepilin-type N-terminal cleavage/methylation domain-containing protein [Cerasicoccus arenae]GHC13340.1 hypothetical protein GCM10007047_33340 [Cerasicoccus arenae]
MLITPITLTRNKKLHAFTLVETLVVIAIIAILATILIPVIQSVRRNAAVSRNISNLRNLQSANQLYATEHSGNYVPVGSFNEKGSYGNFWHENPSFVTEYLGFTDVNQWPEEFLSPWASIRSSDGQLLIERSYGYNYTGLGAYGIPGTSRNANMMTLANPSKTLAFADALDWQIQIYGADRYNGVEEVNNNNTNSAIAYRYNGYAGVVYFDGHAEMLNREQVVDNQELWNIRSTN